MGYRIALPTRSRVTHDDVFLVPARAETGGTVATPSRRVQIWRFPDGSTTVVPQDARGVPGTVAELAPPPIPEVPSPVPMVGGQHGSVESPTRRFIFARDNPWHVAAMNWAGDQITWLRRAFPNTYGLANFVPPRQTRPAWTSNYAEGEVGVAVDSVPYSDKRQVWTLSKEFDDTLWARYATPPAFQKPANMRAYLAGAGYKQLPPYFPRLTQYQTPRSYGQQTQVLPPQPGTTQGFAGTPVSQPIYPTSSGYPNPVGSGMFGSGG